MRGGPVSARAPWLRAFARPTVPQGAVTMVPTDTPVGEVMVTSPSVASGITVFEWRVPKNVRRISVLGITAGTTGMTQYDWEGYGYYSQGFPGALGYLNDLPVTPGEVLTVRVTSPAYYGSNTTCTIQNSRGVAIFVLNRIGTESDWMLTQVNRFTNNAAGASGYMGPGTTSADAPFGSGAAGAMGGVAPFGIGTDGTAATDRHGSRNDPAWPVFGAVFPTEGGGNHPNSAGCVRIIWGPGRNFPFNARKIT